MTIKATTRFGIPYPDTEENVDIPTDLGNGFSRVDDVLSGLADDIETVSGQVTQTTGRSAYQDAVARGFVGTLDEWLASLNGDSGYQTALDQGFTGTEAEWLASLDGDSAYQTWLDLGNTGSEADFIASLKGAKGDKGDPGAPGTSGATALDGLTDVDLTTDAPLEGEVLVRRGTQFVPEPLPEMPAVPVILDDLGDVTAGSPATGQLLGYGSTGQWGPVDPPAGTGGGATTLDGLTDVDLTTDPALDGEVLVKRGTQWVPEPMVSGAGATSLDELSDVDTTTTGPTVGQSLVWNGTTWTPGTVEGSGGTGASVLVIDQGAVVPEGTPEGTIIFERTT